MSKIKKILFSMLLSIFLISIVCGAIILTDFILSTNTIYDFEYNVEDSQFLEITYDNHLMHPAAYVHSADKTLEIINKHNTTNVNYSELLKFIELDETNEIEYIDGYFECGQYAEMFHNNAEAYGINTGIVCISFENYYCGHLINVFNTTDKGLVFVDVTGSDRIVKKLKTGSYLTYGNAVIPDNFHKVRNIYIYW